MHRLIFSFLFFLHFFVFHSLMFLSLCFVTMFVCIKLTSVMFCCPLLISRFVTETFLLCYLKGSCVCMRERETCLCPRECFYSFDLETGLFWKTFCRGMLIQSFSHPSLPFLFVSGTGMLDRLLTLCFCLKSYLGNPITNFLCLLTA